MSQDSTLFPQELVEQFVSGWLADNGLVALSIRAGDRPRASELLDLVAGAKSVYSLVALLCRGQTRIANCATLWQETLNTFETARQAWDGIAEDGEVTLSWHLGQLERLCELSRDRLELYAIDKVDRERFVRSRAADT
jgi:hypothetical protein